METNLPDAYALLLARLMAVEADMAALRERVAELESELHEAWMGGKEKRGWLDRSDEEDGVWIDSTDD